MSSSNADKNLLFGVLALELHFIDRNQLVEAMTAWVLEKSKPLGQLLVEHELLTPVRRELLDGLVTEYLQEHDHDVTASLAALDPAEGVLEDLHEIQDDGLQSTIAFASKPDKSDFAVRDEDLAKVESRETLDRFEILRKHAAGGLGEVFVANDKELHRTVALKRIKSRFADHPKSRERFQLEAEITGRLEHPGVVPVYSLGKQADGQPFYAMRFVEGDDLGSAIKAYQQQADERKAGNNGQLELRRLLQRFIDVCQTIEYAHSRGVLHRDIKPANIMLGEFGETFVVDWGLAKAAGREVSHFRSEESSIHPQHGGGSTPTLSGSAIGTPSYMSPEQAAGRIEELTAASDVYSLGATLYTLLAGAPCVHTTDRKLTLQRVMEGKFSRPREVKPSVPPALEAICLKAMALGPTDRYTSAAAIAEDIEHWLADEPVAAYRESPLERSGRWMRRHRSWVRAGMAGLLLVTLVSVGALVLIDRAWRNERRAREAAIAHFRDARDAVDTWLTGASHVLKYYPAAQRARERLLNLAALDYERFAAQESEVFELQMEAGRAQLRLGDVRRTVGDRERAEQAYRKALGCFRDLRRQHPGAASCAVELANAHTKLGILLVELGRTEEAGPSYAEAIGELENLLRQVTEHRAGRDALATAFLNRGVRFFELGRMDEARASIRRAIDEFARLLEAQPDHRRYLLGAAESRTALGQILLKSGSFREAADNLGTAVVRLDALVQEYPDNVELLDARAATQIQIAGLQRTQGHYDLERAAYRRAIDDYQALRRALPDVVVFEENLALTQTDLAQLHLKQGRVKDAEQVAREALEVFQSLARDFPDVPRHVEEQAACLDVLGRALSDFARYDEARRAHEQAVGLFGQLGLRYPDVSEYRVRLAVARSHLGQILHKLGESDAARKEFQVAVDRLWELESPESVDTLDILAQVLVELGGILTDSNQSDEATDAYRQAMELWQTLVARADAADYANRYAWWLAMCPVDELRDPDEASEQANHACTLAPENPDYAITLAAALLRLGDATAAEEKLRLAQKLRPGPHGRDLLLLAMAKWQQDDREAARHYDEAVAWMQQHQPDNLDLIRLRGEVDKLFDG